MKFLVSILLLWCMLPAFAADGRKLLPRIAPASPSVKQLPPTTTAPDPNGFPHYLATNATARASQFTNPDTAMPFLYADGKWSQAFYQYKPFQARWSKTCWLYGTKGLSATCLGYTNGHGGVYPITMVSPRHYVMTWHIAGWFPFCAGKDAAVFLDTNNVVHKRTSIKCENAGNDVAVGLLDSDLPASVEFLPILPTAYTNYVKDTDWLQGIGANQDLLAFSQPMQMHKSGVLWDPNVPCVRGLPQNWSVRLRNGDSAFPERVLLGNQLVLLSCTTTIYGGANYAALADRINNTMHRLSTEHHLATDYQLTTVDLSRFAPLR